MSALRLGLRGKQIAVLTLVAFLVAIVTSAMNLAAITRVQVQGTLESATQLAQGFYHQVASAMAADGDPIDRLRRDPAVRGYAEAAIGYSPVTLYLAVIRRDESVLFHTEASRIGAAAVSERSLRRFSKENVFLQLWTLLGEHQVLAVDLPFTIDGTHPYGSVRVAISTLLLRQEIRRELVRNASLTGAVVLLSFLLSFVLAQLVLAPFERLRRKLAGVDTAGEGPLDLRTDADVDRLAEFFESIGHRLRDGSEDEQRDLLPTTLGGLTDAVVVADADRRLLAANPAAASLLGTAETPSRGQPIGEWIDPDHPIAALIEEVLQEGEGIVDRTITLTDSGSREREYLVSAQLLGGWQPPVGVILIARDVQKLSRLASRLSYSQKLTALGRLTAGVAHEIRNPLNAMRLQVALLQDGGDSDEADRRQRLTALDADIDRLNRVVQAFSEFTRPEELRVATVGIESLLEETMERIGPLARSAGIDLRLDLPKRSFELLADRDLLGQALFNLAKNGIEAMEAGGRLTLGARGPDRGSSEFVVTVEDTGAGIAEENLPRVFDLHYTTKRNGSGVGLSLVYRIVQLHGGDIDVESTVGRGTRFELRFPEGAA